jgi:hypothetical protein
MNTSSKIGLTIGVLTISLCIVAYVCAQRETNIYYRPLKLGGEIWF